MYNDESLVLLQGALFLTNFSLFISLLHHFKALDSHFFMRIQLEVDILALI